MTKANWRKVTHFISSVFLYVILTIIGIVFIMFLAYFIDQQVGKSRGEARNPLFGAYVIISESMIPTINVKDAVITMRVTEKDIKVNDIITFISKEIKTQGTPITHRVVGIVYEDPPMNTKVLGYRTKGDNNNTQDLCNCHKYHHEYNPIINNNSVQFDSKFGEQVINQNDFKYNCRPIQTLINITPMRTIFRPNYSNDIPYNNKERYFRSEGYREYRPLTPSNHMHNEKRFNEFERYGCSPGVPKRKNSFSFYHKENVGGRIVHSYVNNEEMNRGMGCTCYSYAK